MIHSYIKLESSRYVYEFVTCIYKTGKWYKYFVGNYKSHEEAITRQEEVRKMGYDTAFIVAYEDGNKVDVKYAQEKINPNNKK